MEIWAHRGRTSPRQLGNSLRNFMAAQNLDITGIETDVCFTLGLEKIIYHPGSTKPDLSFMSLENIKNSIFDILELSSFLDFFSNFSKIRCFLDIKDNSEELVLQVIEEVVRRNLQDRIYLTAFQKRLPTLGIESSGELLAIAKEINPNIKTHLIATWPYNLVKIAEKYNPDVISFGWLLEPTTIRLISRLMFKSMAHMVDFKEQIRQVRLREIKVLAGIVNDQESMQYFMDLGVDGIVTDDPLEAIAFKNRPGNVYG